MLSAYSLTGTRDYPETKCFMRLIGMKWCQEDARLPHKRRKRLSPLSRTKPLPLTFYFNFFPVKKLVTRWLMSAVPRMATHIAWGRMYSLLTMYQFYSVMNYVFSSNTFVGAQIIAYHSLFLIYITYNYRIITILCFYFYLGLGIILILSSWIWYGYPWIPCSWQNFMKFVFYIRIL